MSSETSLINSTLLEEQNIEISPDKQKEILLPLTSSNSPIIPHDDTDLSCSVRLQPLNILALVEKQSTAVSCYRPLNILLTSTPKAEPQVCSSGEDLSSSQTLSPLFLVEETEVCEHRSVHIISTLKPKVGSNVCRTAKDLLCSKTQQNSSSSLNERKTQKVFKHKSTKIPVTFTPKVVPKVCCTTKNLPCSKLKQPTSFSSLFAKGTGSTCEYRSVEFVVASTSRAASNVFNSSYSKAQQQIVIPSLTKQRIKVVCEHRAVCAGIPATLKSEAQSNVYQTGKILTSTTTLQRNQTIKKSVPIPPAKSHKPTRIPRYRNFHPLKYSSTVKNKCVDVSQLRTEEVNLKRKNNCDNNNNHSLKTGSSAEAYTLETKQANCVLSLNSLEQRNNGTTNKTVTHDTHPTGDFSPCSITKQPSRIPEGDYPYTFCSRRSYITSASRAELVKKQLCSFRSIFGSSVQLNNYILENSIDQTRGRRLRTPRSTFTTFKYIKSSVIKSSRCFHEGHNSIMENVLKSDDETVSKEECVDQNGLPHIIPDSIGTNVIEDSVTSETPAVTILRPTTLDKSVSPIGSSSNAGSQLKVSSQTGIPTAISPKTPKTSVVTKSKVILPSHTQQKSEPKQNSSTAHSPQQKSHHKSDKHHPSVLKTPTRVEANKLNIIKSDTSTQTLTEIKSLDILQVAADIIEAPKTPKTPPVTPDTPLCDFDDDIDSMYSFETTTSGRSTMSCEHPYVARNGTTFSGRRMKYVVHCSNYAGQVGPDYLTPTQRAQRQLRRLKELLIAARSELELKDSEIIRLTREVVELRLFKASLSSPEERSASSDAVTVREAELKTSQDVSPIIDMVDDATKSSPRHVSSLASQPHHQQVQQTAIMSSEMQSSFADSGHFEDLTSSSVNSKEGSYTGITHDIACGNDEAAGIESTTAHEYELQRQELIRMYEHRIEELIRSQDNVNSEIKRTHNDKIEALLQKLADCNTRYADLVPDYEHAKERIRELEKQVDDLQRKLAEQEEKQNKMYLHMYQQGQEAERIARADQALELAYRAPNKVSINELLIQLQTTQDELENIRTIYRRLLEAQKSRCPVDPEVTLQFLKSAIYYFLTDKENSQGHLQVIESILEFTEAEKQNISKARSPK
ncbi:uncharacterized protein LOC119661985 isoform X2 [Teleopsis dalmanni]|uniref:uncharacterized protein LOC119661985 isoform X2 n=1 Tax=Teleopsis dalmanni TaxID=139649 RepID=UPI0018CDB2B0|nr:uncharacterized protein LOC119661985 isoform X2 [Teleopsis dalmanni]